MTSIRVKLLLVAVFGLFSVMSSNRVIAQEDSSGNVEKTEQATAGKKEGKIKPGEILMEHILDAHEFHFITIGQYEVSIPLPVILYSPQKGFTSFMSSHFNHGHSAFQGYQLVDGKVKAVNEDGSLNESVKVYDLSMTRNVVQMLLGLVLLLWMLISVAGKYTKNGAMKAPSGLQGFLEPVIIFIRDEVGKSNLGHNYERFMPYLLSVFFFILIGNLIGLIPGTANVTGNISFTIVLGVISFIIIMANTNKHYWMEIINPSAPGFVKPILFIVELLSVFTKPFALIVRLFANMIAGHMIITCLIVLIFIFGELNTFAGYGFAPISLAFTIFIYFIEILVAFIQAFIFANLTAVFISQAFEGAPHEEEAAI